MGLSVAAVTVALLAGILATTTSSAMQHRTLYQRLGGRPAITAVVDDFVKNVAADKRINGFFANANIPRLKTRLVEQICQGTAGPRQDAQQIQGARARAEGARRDSRADEAGYRDEVIGE
jgi:truncated hemoglobin YjbI